MNEEHIRDDLKSQLNSSERRRAADHAELDKTATKLDAVGRNIPKILETFFC